MRTFILASVAIASLAACERTELITPEAGTCDGLEEANRWPWFSDEGPVVTSTGFEVGDTAPDFQLVDQFGEPVCLWQFSGKVVIVDASALWCGPCKDIAKHAACVADSYGGELVYLTFIGQDEASAPAEYPDNETWASQFGLSEGSLTPVVADGTQVFLRQEWAPNFPSFMLLDRDMKILAKGEGRSAEAEMRAKATEILGEPSESCE